MHEPAPRREIISLAGIIVDSLEPVADESVLEHVLCARFLQRVVGEVHYAVSDHDSLQVDVFGVVFAVLVDDERSQVGDVFARVALTCDLSRKGGTNSLRSANSAAFTNMKSLSAAKASSAVSLSVQG